MVEVVVNWRCQKCSKKERVRYRNYDEFKKAIIDAVPAHCNKPMLYSIEKYDDGIEVEESDLRYQYLRLDRYRD